MTPNGSPAGERRTGFRRFRYTSIALGLILVFQACGPGLTGGTATTPAASTAVTPEVPLTAPSGVNAKCGLTMLTDGRLVARCRFTNTNQQRVRFLYCMMINLRQELVGPGVSGTSGDHVRVSKSGNVVSCTKQDATGQFTSTSFHFGCEQVDLQPQESKIITLEGASVYRAPPGVTPKAQDFFISYADAAILDSDDTYDSTNCRLGLGEEQAGFVTFIFGGGFIGQYWVVDDVPFADSFIRYQPLSGEGKPKEYSLFEDSPCLPEGFPARVRQLKKCRKGVAEPPPLPIDLHLFFLDSHTASKDKRFPVVMKLQTQGDAKGIRFETEPALDKPFEIPGGVERFGTLRACAADVRDRCIVPKVEEGRRLSVTIRFMDPETRRTLFPEYIRFTQDTEPPAVEKATLANGTLEVTARDATTSPVHATAWFSSKGGKSWVPQVMSADPPVIGESSRTDEAKVRTFRVQAPAAKGSVQYFVEVHDVVFNITVFGIQNRG